ncbi:2-dehydropantoate 2-reductase [Bacillus sp. CECT 9360]|uniref:ketopantoate reductase family protein n=1 Tax=Bacillus sp. CECT 9360 TaxID=2845821 RepID=UPI001E3C74F0|nr:2-dehydropantoate 2-reductase [Bacillus sp. CECT 9360]CAH0345240.1 2-dehydropantoate 2-reductase [Bacillus sp. CECT 9360]
MNIVIVGAGALGAYYGGRWEEAGQSVQFLVRKNRARQLKEQGLYITSTHGNYQFDKVDFTENVEEIKTPDLVVLAVKGYHLKGTIPSLKNLVANGAKVLPLLNGIEQISILQQELGEEAVIGGSAYIIATLDDKGHVVHTNQQHDLVFGPLHPSQQEICNKLETISGKAKMNSRLSGQILWELWNKYMFITAFSGVTTASNLPIGIILSYPETSDLLKKVLVEMQLLARAQGISITDESVSQAFSKFQAFPEEATSSMHQDKRKGLTLELDHLQGGALRLAEKEGISLPVISILYGLIKPYENS